MFSKIFLSHVCLLIISMNTLTEPENKIICSRLCFWKFISEQTFLMNSVDAPTMCKPVFFGYELQREDGHDTIHV